MAQRVSPIQMPGISKSFRVMAKMMLVISIPKRTRVNFVRKFVLVISWVVRIGSMGISLGFLLILKSLS